MAAIISDNEFLYNDCNYFRLGYFCSGTMTDIISDMEFW